MPNQYHDEAGRFCSRDQMRAALRSAANQGKVSTWIRLKDDLQKADISTNYLPSSHVGLVHPAVKYAQTDIEERDEILERGNREEIQKWVTERVNNEDFIDLLDERDVMKTRARGLDGEYKALEKQAKLNPELDYEVVREKGFESLAAYEEFILLKNQANEYKDITALAVAKLSEKITEEQKADGTFREYTESTLNELVETGTFPSGSREWLEQRQNGIGGSDVGKIIGTSGENSWDRRDYNDVLVSKVDRITDEEVENQSNGHSEYTGYAGRGNAWEDYIVHKFSENNPNANVTHCKTSWQHKHDTHQFANFDGLMTDENGIPNGILEIKTASDATKWKDTSLGLEGVPAAYKYQALWYADAAGFEKGAVAVMIDDREYREYHFTMTPQLRQDIEEAKEKVAAFNAHVERVKSGEDIHPYTPRNIAGRQGFSDTFLTAVRTGKDYAFTEAAILREEKVEDTKARYREIIGGDGKDKEKSLKALKQLYTEKPLSERTKNFINIDIETNSTSQTAGHIIEMGISVQTPYGEEVSKISKLYGLPARSLAATSTGAVEVHGITEGMISKKRTFRHKEEQKKVLDTLKSGIMVAHNLPYEMKWLRLHLDGFAEAERKGEIVGLDTKNLTQRILTNTKNNKLSAFTENYGIPYKNAHRAYNDALMMAQGLTRFLADRWTND